MVRGRGCIRSWALAWRKSAPCFQAAAQVAVGKSTQHLVVGIDDDGRPRFLALISRISGKEIVVRRT